MTTNHRPTLESKKGKVQSISGSIVHARGLPQNSRLKLRSDRYGAKINHDAGSAGVKELNKKLSIDSKVRDEDNTEDTEKVFIQKENQEQSEGNSSDGTNSDSDSEGDSDSDDSEDETAELMKELENLKKEKEQQRIKLENDRKIESAKTSNPLMRISDTSAGDGFKVKKNWRSSTFRKPKENPTKANDNYTNDTLNSDHHQGFLSKYVN